MIKSILLDSGAYSVYRQGKKIDIEKYAEFVKVNKDVFSNAFNLDVLTDKVEDKKMAAGQSYTNWKLLRERGVNTIPVFHIGTDTRYLLKYMEQTDYIAIGAVANLSSVQRMVGLDHIWKNFLTDANGMPKVKTHALGITAIDLLIRYPWYSVDSSSPLLMASFGGIVLPKFRNGEPIYTSLLQYKVSNEFEHVKGNKGCWPNLPQLYREQCTNLLENFGFSMGFSPRVVRKRVMKSLNKQPITSPPTLFTNDDTVDTKGTLAGDWESRLSWNVLMFEKLAKHLPQYPRPFTGLSPEYQRIEGSEGTLVHTVCSNISNFKIYKQSVLKPHILISYAFMSDGFLEQIKTYNDAN